jgi:predicted DNA binding protein
MGHANVLHISIRIMLEYTFKIAHKGCWTESIHNRFPDISATIIHSYWLHGTSITMIEVMNVDPNEVNDVVRWLRDHEVMTVAQLVSYDDKQHKAFISLAGDYKNETVPVLNVLLRNRCFPTIPATVSNGYEHWSVIVSDHEQLSSAHDDLENIGSVRVDALTSPNLDQLITGLSEVKQAVQNLTPRQHEVLLRAIENGYYDSPRDCNIEELAAMDTANTSTVGEHLRRSEAKILKAIAPLLARSSESDVRETPPVHAD